MTSGRTRAIVGPIFLIVLGGRDGQKVMRGWGGEKKQKEIMQRKDDRKKIVQRRKPIKNLSTGQKHSAQQGAKTIHGN